MKKFTWDRPNPFTIKVTASSEHIDGYGHVSNVCFIQWLTDCAWAHSAAVGLPEGACVEMERGMAIRNVNVEFLASAYADDHLIVANWVTEVDRKLRATRQFQIVNNETGKSLLRGQLNFVCVNLKNGRPTRMPPLFLERYVITV